MNLAIVGSGESWYVRDLIRAAADRHQIRSVTFSQLASTVLADRLTVTSGDATLNKLDAVLVRTMPPGSLEQVVFRMDALAQVEQAGTLVMNPARSLEVAVDKYLATVRLQQAGLLVPETTVCQTVEEAMAAYERLGGDVVVKPLFGSEGRGITRVSDEALALRAFKLLSQMGAVLYLQRFIQHEGCDLRILVVGDRLFGMRRRNALDWRTNASRGAHCEPLPVDDRLAHFARTAAQAVGAPLAGVDLLPGRDGHLYAIEVNAVPGWRALQRTLNLDIADAVLEFLTTSVAAH